MLIVFSDEYNLLIQYKHIILSLNLFKQRGEQRVTKEILYIVVLTLATFYKTVLLVTLTWCIVNDMQLIKYR